MLTQGLQELCNENRTNRRQVTRLRARVQVGFANFRPARTLDMSQSGARLEIDTEIVEGTKVALNLTPEPMRQLAVRGEVVWITPSWREGCFQIGVRFESTGKADQAWLNRKFCQL